MGGTSVLTPSGSISIENLKRGDTVLGVNDNATIPVTVQSVVQIQPNDYFEITLNGVSLYVTAEHPIETEPGVFRIASFLQPGDPVIIKNKTGLKPAFIESIKRVQVASPAYNILVAPAGTYIANGIVVHNKGCFLPETPIRRADGTEVPISQVKRHDRLLAFKSDGQVVQTTVHKVLTHDVNEYCIVKVGNMIFQVTKEHPFYIGSGEFKTLEALKIGDKIVVFDGTGLSAQRIESIETIHARSLVYNLQTDTPNTYFANGAAVHNKGGGCFPSGTLIKTPGGDLAIEHLKAGDAISTVDHNGKPVLSRVKETHTTHSPLLIIKTSRGLLKTTREHPLALASGGFRPAGELSPDDEILTWKDNQTKIDTVIDKSCLDTPETVYNLTVDWPHTFIADGFIVHNKGGGGFHGGGGYHGSGSSSSGDSDIAGTIILIAFCSPIVIILIVASKQWRRDNLDYTYTTSDISKKRDKTITLLEFIAKQDPAVAPEALQKTVETTFLKLQQCWQARDYSPMKPLLMPDLYQDHLLEIQGMVRNHEINMISDLKIDKIDLVNIRYTQNEAQREFTALITATAQDYYIDDRTNARLRGDEKPAQFQEFWTFHYMNKSWLLREIEQTRESDILKEENFFEQFTDKAIEQIYGDSASNEGPAGPALEKEVETKETRIERMLNFLSKTDKIWDRDTMLITTRRIFLELMVAWETGDAAAVPSNDLIPEFADDLRDEISKNRKEGISREFRNLCVRKVELILVNNFADNSKDEFIARVRAHAQKIMRRKESILQQDEDVTPFEQFLTLGRHDNNWKLKEIVSADASQGLIKQENLDQDSSPQQLKWYYQHKRTI